MNNTGYVIGVAVGGLIVGLVFAGIIIKICNKDKSLKTEYDERQYIARLKSFKAGFLTTAIVGAVLGLLSLAGVEIPALGIVKYWFPIICGVIGMVSAGIWTDGYWGINFNKKRFIILMSLVTLINIFVPVMAMANGTFFNSEGLMDIPALSLLVAIMFVLLIIQSALKDYIDKKIEDEIDAREDDE